MLKALLIKILIVLLSLGTVTTVSVITINIVKEAKENASNETINVDDSTEIEEHVHTLILTPSVEATCTENGLTEGKKCADCGEIIVSQQVIPAIGHVYKNGVCINCGAKEPQCEHTNTEVIQGYGASCVTCGLTDGVKCTDCGQIIVVQSVIPASGHKYENGICTTCYHHKHDDCDPTNLQVITGYPATCQQSGLTDGVVCLECGEIITAQNIIEKLDHNYLYGICVNCGSKESSTCNHTNTTTIKGFSATCTQNGLTDGKRCANCGAIVEAQSVIKALGHNYVNGVCTRCGASDPNTSGDNETERIVLE